MLEMTSWVSHVTQALVLTFDKSFLDQSYHISFNAHFPGNIIEIIIGLLYYDRADGLAIRKQYWNIHLEWNIYVS